MSEFVLELRGITKTFPGVKALDHVQFQLKPGEIHALMGENGAGKSTFIKVITGVHQPDEGKMYLNGQEVEFRNPKDAQNCGIAAIYQHVTCFPDLSVTEKLAPIIKKSSAFLISESGIKTIDDVKRIVRAGANGILVGETFMRAENIEETLKAMKLPLNEGAHQ